MSNDRIYVIMIMTDIRQDGKNQFPHFSCSSIVGYYFDKDQAFRAVQENACDINETSYTFALIEEVEEGLYNPASSDSRWFFEYDRASGRYCPMAEPKFLKHYCGFTIG